MREVGVGFDSEEELFKELLQGFGISVGPAARRHTVNLVNVDDKTHSAWVFEHWIGLHINRDKKRVS